MPRQSTRGTGRGRSGSKGSGGGGEAPPVPPEDAAGDDPTGGAIEPIEIQEEMERSFLEYSMSVIVARALPDVRDGLKPVHRRILYSMFDNGLRPDRPHNKCAKVVGEVMGTYHPHGDSAIYEALARMVAMTASSMSMARRRPSTMCARLRALSSRNCERRVMTSI